MGLAICHNIIEKHNGLIEALNNTGGGLTIRIELPGYILSADNNA